MSFDDPGTEKPVPHPSVGRRHSLENEGRRFFCSLVLTLLGVLAILPHVVSAINEY